MYIHGISALKVDISKLKPGVQYAHYWMSTLYPSMRSGNRYTISKIVPDGHDMLLIIRWIRLRPCDVACHGGLGQYVLSLQHHIIVCVHIHTSSTLII